MSGQESPNSLYVAVQKTILMSRLYYEKKREVSPPAPTTRSTRSISRNAPPAEEVVVERRETSSGGYLEKIAKLIPSEIIAAYLAMIGFVPLIQIVGNRQVVYWVIFGLCQILTPLYLNRQAEKGQPKINHLILSSIAFAVWAYVTTGSSLVPNFYDAALGSIMLIGFSLVSAMVPLNR